MSKKPQSVSYKNIIKMGLLLFIIITPPIIDLIQLKQSTFTFDGHTYTLSKTIKEFQKKNHFKYGCYSGFEGETKNFDVSMQLEAWPVFGINDNTTESDWEDHNIAGITFSNYSDTMDILKFEKQLETQYNKKFVYITNKYKQFQTNEGITIIISNRDNNNHISFYYGVKSEDIAKYVEYCG